MKQDPVGEDTQSFAQDIVDTLRSPLLVLDEALRVRSANRAFYLTFNVSPKETEGNFIYELGIGQWDIPTLRNLLEQVIPTSSELRDYEVEFDFPTVGHKVMLLSACELRPGDYGKHILLTIEDVTARHLAERLLDDLEAYAQNIVDTVREPFLILDGTLVVRSANRAFYENYDVVPSETEGRLIYELGNGQWDIPALRILLEDIVPQSSVFSDYQVEHDFPHIGRRVMLLNGRKLRAGNHSELILLAIADITERELIHDREISFTMELQRTVTRLQELEKIRDDLTHMIIHDLRTPLTSVIAGIQTLGVVGELNGDQRDMVDIALGGGGALLGMINDLLDVERAESDSMTLEYSQVSVLDLVTSSVGQIAFLAQSKSLTLLHLIAPNLPILSADEGKLQRTLVNLLGNAIKFTPAGGTVTIEASLHASLQSISFSVSDTGEGIPAEAIDSIFEKFRQVESRQGGRQMSTGLGLTFSKLAVEAHGGQIYVESSPAEGSRFCFNIPLIPPHTLMASTVAQVGDGRKVESDCER